MHTFTDTLQMVKYRMATPQMCVQLGKQIRILLNLYKSLISI